ncbi:hypothetical protein EG329_010789 [Mollisiaceae sp. DMI_Dod_QoI]|nr:hypothetical protein EG329_010789 [Helotiales sp. DMI_Dod_QoI]
MAAEDRGPQIAAVAILFLTLTWIFVGLRCYVRTVMMKSFGMDDWLAVAALVLFTLYCSFVLKGVQYGTGQHFANLPPENIPIALKWWWCSELAYISSTAVFKASICIFLFRICVTRSQIFTIWLVLGVVTAYSVFYFFLVIFQCSPVAYFWTQYLGASGHCIHASAITGTSYAHSAVSCWADWTLGILPVFLVWNLSMNTRTKISVALILALGAFGSTATIVRIPFLKQLVQSDFLYSATDVAIWSTVEPGIGITTGAMATLRPLFRTFLSRSKLFGSSARSGDKNSAWPLSGQANRVGYFRSARGKKDGKEAFGLRNDIAKGVGITTTIQSMRNRDLEGDYPPGENSLARSASQKALNWQDNETMSKDDSSEEFLPMQRLAGQDWAVHKTTQVTTSQELKHGTRGG